MEKSIFIELLLKAQKEKKLISISTDEEDTDRFLAGYIVDLDNETLLLNSITPDGIDDGLIVINLNDIYLVEYDDQYLKSLQLMIDNSQELIRKTDFSIPKENNDDTFNSILDKCRDEHILVSINLVYGVGYWGYIIKIDEENILLNGIDESGREDGMACLQISDVFTINIDDKKLRKIKLLEKQYK